MADSGPSAELGVNANTAVVSYELYVLDSRGWMLHARFTRQQREAGMNEARHLENFLKTGVKLVRETYFPSTNNCQEEVVYCTPKFASVAEASPSVAAAAYPGPARKSANSYAEDSAPAKGMSAASAQRAKREADNMIGLVVKLLAIMAASMAAGGFAAAIGGFVLGNLKQIGLYNGSTGSLSFAIFLVVFVLTALPLAATFLRLDFAPSRPAPRKAERRPPPKVERKRPPPRPVPEVKKEEPPPEEKAEEEAPSEEVPEATEVPGGTPLDDRKADMTRFLGGAVNVLMASKPQLDKSARFAMNLFLAGAVEVLGDRRGMSEEDRKQVLLDVLKKFGTKEDMASLFASKYDEYLMLPANMSMVQAGRGAMSKQLDGDSGAGGFAELVPALDAYQAPQNLKQAPQQAITTVIFTDMVGSTDLTQEKGDQAAQEVVRRHNTIVRNALREFTGREIKHTGDGIMASFNSASNAVEACIQIQRQVIAHNQKNADLPMHLRIGMNAGEPIQEENDLFGTTVQLAARVCAKADSDEIFCSNVIKDLNSGKAYKFVHRGDYDLKGFKDPLPLYEVIWR